MIKEIVYKIRSTKELEDTIYLYVLQIVDRIIPLVVIPYLMIILGSESYGYIGFAAAIANYLVLFVDFGFNLSATKRIAIAKEQNSCEVSEVFFSTVSAKFLLFLISSAVIIPVILLVPSLKIYIKTVLYSFPIVLGATLNISWFYQGIGKIRIAAIVTSLCKICILPLVFIFVNEPTDYNSAAFIQSSVYLLSSVVTWLLLFRTQVIVKTKIGFQNVIMAIRDSYPLFLSSVATSAYTQLFTLILGFLSTPAIVGKYSAAERIMRSICIAVYSPITQAFYPKISSLSCTNRKMAEKLFHKLVVFIFILMLLLSIFLFVFAKQIVSLLGSDYLGLESLLRIVSFVPIAIAMGAIYGQMGLIAMGNKVSKSNFQRVYFMAAPLSLFLVTILAYLYSDIGAAIALFLTEYFVFIFMYLNSLLSTKNCGLLKIK